VISRPLYSYRGDPAVPAFDDAHPLALVDGECALSSRTATVVSRLDAKEEFRIAPVKGALGRALLAHYGLDADDPLSWLYLEDGRAYAELEAVARAGCRLGGLGWLAVPLGWAPPRVREAVYGWVARNRIRWFGRADLCAQPDAGLRRRLLS
jgi:predicted DCC family thiol-disulfide oxidoreductase YuxK